MRIRIRLNGWYDNDKTTLKVEHHPTGSKGTVERRFVRKEKIKELEEFGYAYTNLPKEYIV